MQTYTHTCTDMHTHIYTCRHRDTHKHIYICRHIHTHRRAYAHRAEGIQPDKEQVAQLPNPRPSHTRAHLSSLACIYCTPIGCMAQRLALVRNLSWPLRASPAWGSSRPQGWLQAWTGRGGPAGRWRGRASASRRQAGSPWAHLAEQRQWWLLPQPSLLPTGTASDLWVSRTTPRPTLKVARGQLQGTHREGRGSEGPGAPGEWSCEGWDVGRGSRPPP